MPLTSWSAAVVQPTWSASSSHQPATSLGTLLAPMLSSQNIQTKTEPENQHPGAEHFNIASDDEQSISDSPVPLQMTILDEDSCEMLQADLSDEIDMRSQHQRTTQSSADSRSKPTHHRNNLDMFSKPPALAQQVSPELPKPMPARPSLLAAIQQPTNNDGQQSTMQPVINNNNNQTLRHRRKAMQVEGSVNEDGLCEERSHGGVVTLEGLLPVTNKGKEFI
jgi:hypothetical protein